MATIQDKRAWLSRFNNSKIKRAYLYERMREASDQGELLDRIQRIDKCGNQYKSEILIAISGLEDPRLSDILTYRYIDGLTIEEISNHSGYCRRHVFRLQARAIKEITIDSLS